jgi:hypothetical protein
MAAIQGRGVPNPRADSPSMETADATMRTPQCGRGHESSAGATIRGTGVPNPRVYSTGSGCRGHRLMAAAAIRGRGPNPRADLPGSGCPGRGSRAGAARDVVDAERAGRRGRAFHGESSGEV